MSIEIYGQPGCRYCESAKQLCEKYRLPYVYHDISTDEVLKDEFFLRTNGARTVPQIFVADVLVGGFTEFNNAVLNGIVEQMLGGS